MGMILPGRRERHRTAADSSAPASGVGGAANEAPGTIDRVALRRLLGLAHPYWRLLAGGAVCLVVASGLGLVLPWLVRYLVDSIVETRDTATLYRVLAALAAAFLLQAVFNVGQSYLLSAAGERLVADLRRKLYAHLQGLSVSFFDRHRTGELLSRLTNDVAAIQNSLTNDLLDALRQCILLAGALALVLITDWRLLAVVLVLLAPILVIGSIVGGRVRALAHAEQTELGSGTAVLEETLSGMRTVQAFAREAHEVDRYGRSVERTYALAMQRTRLFAVFTPLMMLLVFIALTGALVFGLEEVNRGLLTPGELVAALLYMLIVAGAVGALTGVYTQLCQASGAAVRLFELLGSVPEVREAPDARPLSQPPHGQSGRVQIEGLCFRYPTFSDLGRPWTVQDIWLDVAPGETLALVGPSGAGKSTLVSLLLRLYDPTVGRVLVDGADIRGVTLRSLREALGVVPQDPVLFGRTVAENIAYGQPDACAARVEAAARAAHAHEFIVELPEQYQTVIGERGVTLSGGQRQRIAIARAILKNPRLLILDEATSSLDVETEAAVRVALANLMRGRTTIVIAHRLSTVERADRIVVLDRGRIVAAGRHHELLARGGLYQRLYTAGFPRADIGDGAAHAVLPVVRG